MAAEQQPFKDRYTIQDLENLSGIQAHTLRIWEKRYDLLHPLRAGNNVRYYSHGDLVKLLNVAVLYHHNYKISKIAALTDVQLIEKVSNETLADKDGDFTNHSLKLAMLNYDPSLFDRTMQHLLSQMSFRECFSSVFLPFLADIGLLWQTGVITIAHEHFLSNLLRQKILGQIDQLHPAAIRPEASVFVLFLPINELHEIGLLYSHYELLLHGHHSIYLGQSVPAEVLSDVQAGFPSITFITAWTIHPKEEEIEGYVKAFSTKILRKGKDELWIFGRKMKASSTVEKIRGIRYLQSPEMFLKSI